MAEINFQPPPLFSKYYCSCSVPTLSSCFYISDGLLKGEFATCRSCGAVTYATSPSSVLRVYPDECAFVSGLRFIDCVDCKCHHLTACDPCMPLVVCRNGRVPYVFLNNDRDCVGALPLAEFTDHITTMMDWNLSFEEAYQALFEYRRDLRDGDLRELAMPNLVLLPAVANVNDIDIGVPNPEVAIVAAEAPELSSVRGIATAGTSIAPIVESDQNQMVPYTPPGNMEKPWTFQSALENNHVATITWPSTAASDTQLLAGYYNTSSKAVCLPFDLYRSSNSTYVTWLKPALLSFMFDNFTYWSCDEMVLRFSSVGNPSYAGILQLYWLPYYNMNNVANATYATTSQFDSKYLYATLSQQEELSIPWSACIENQLLCIPTSGTPYGGWYNSSFKFIFAQLYARVLNQIVAGTGITGSVSINMYVLFKNPQFKIPRTPSGSFVILPAEANGNQISYAISDSTISSSQLNPSTKGPQFDTDIKAATGAGTVGDAPKKGKLKDKAGAAAGSLPKEAPSEEPSLDNPNLPNNIMRLMRTAYPEMNMLSRQNFMNRLSAYASQSLPTTARTGHAKNPMTWEEIFSYVGYYDKFSIAAAATPYTAPVFAMPVCPAAKLLATGSYTSTYNLGLAPYEMWCLSGNYWRGSIIVFFRFDLSAFTEAQLAFSFTTGVTGSPTTFSNVVQQGATFYTVRGADRNRCHAVILPFISTEPWRKVPRGDTSATALLETVSGYLTVWLASAVTANTVLVPGAITGFVYTAAGPDFEFYGYNSGARQLSLGIGVTSNELPAIANVNDGELAAAVVAVLGPDTVNMCGGINPIVTETLSNPIDMLRRFGPLTNIYLQGVPDPRENPTKMKAGTEIIMLPITLVPSICSNYVNLSNCNGQGPSGLNYPTTRDNTGAVKPCNTADHLSFYCTMYQRYSGGMDYMVDYHGAWEGKVGDDGWKISRIRIYRRPFDLPSVDWGIFDPSDTKARALTVSKLIAEYTYNFYKMQEPANTGINGPAIGANTVLVNTDPVGILTPEAPVFQFQVPFDGIYPQHFVNNGQLQGKSTDTNPSYLYATTAGPLGLIFICIDYHSLSAASLEAMRTALAENFLTVRRCASDDFMPSTFVGVPPVYINTWRLNTGTDFVSVYPNLWPNNVAALSNDDDIEVVSIEEWNKLRLAERKKRLPAEANVYQGTGNKIDGFEPCGYTFKSSIMRQFYNPERLSQYLAQYPSRKSDEIWITILFAAHIEYLTQPGTYTLDGRILDTNNGLEIDKYLRQIFSYYLDNYPNLVCGFDPEFSILSYISNDGTPTSHYSLGYPREREWKYRRTLLRIDWVRIFSDRENEFRERVKRELNYNLYVKEELNEMRRLAVERGDPDPARVAPLEWMRAEMDADRYADLDRRIKEPLPAEANVVAGPVVKFFEEVAAGERQGFDGWSVDWPKPILEQSFGIRRTPYARIIYFTFGIPDRKVRDEIACDNGILTSEETSVMIRHLASLWLKTPDSYHISIEIREKILLGKDPVSILNEAKQKKRLYELYFSEAIVVPEGFETICLVTMPATIEDGENSEIRSLGKGATKAAAKKDAAERVCAIISVIGGELCGDIQV